MRSRTGWLTTRLPVWPISSLLARVRTGRVRAVVHMTQHTCLGCKTLISASDRFCSSCGFRVGLLVAIAVVFIAGLFGIWLISLPESP